MQQEFIGIVLEIHKCINLITESFAFGMFCNQVSLQCNAHVINYRWNPELLALSAFGGDAFPKT